MRRIVPIALASAVLAACSGGGETSSSADTSSGQAVSSTPSVSSAPVVSSEPIVSSAPAVSSEPTTSSVPVVSSAPAVSSAPPASSAPSSVTTTSSASNPGPVSDLYSSFTPDPLSGARLYYSSDATGIDGKLCVGCHIEQGEEPSPSRFTIDVAKYYERGSEGSQSLFTKIHAEMPSVATTGKCDNQCAADITAYLLTWESARPNVVACDVADPMTYAPRAVKLLTTREYQNSLEDLLNVDQDFSAKLVADATLGGFPNNAFAPLNGRIDVFWSVANEVAAWAVQNDQPFPCGENDSCGFRFINDFLPKVYRQTLTEEDRDQFKTIFNDFPGREGVEAALVTAFNSPKFLYRQELGTKVSEVLSTDPEPYWRPVPGSSLTWFIKEPDDGGAFADMGNYQGGQIPYEWTGRDIINVTVKGSIGATYKFSAANKQFGPFTIESEAPVVHSFTIEAASSASKQVQMDAQFPGGQGNFWSSALTVGEAELYTPQKGDVDKMQQADPDSYILTPYEYASLLAYTLTGSTPDDELMMAASNDGLHYQDDIRAQVQRLLDSPRGREHIGYIVDSWLGTGAIVDPEHNRDPVLYADYTPAVRESLAEELRQVFREVFYNDLPVSAFYDGSFTMLNSTLSDYYGIASGSTGPDDWVKVSNIPGRGGLLASGAFMAVYSTSERSRPIVRAVRTRELLMCQHPLPAAAANDDETDAAKAEANMLYNAGQITTRQYNEIITSPSSCDACHKNTINPMFGMEDFDHMGKQRTFERRPDLMGGFYPDIEIDARGTLYGPYEVSDNSESIDFEGAMGLSQIIAGLPGSKECVIEKSFWYVAGLPISDNAKNKANIEFTDEQAADYACVADNARNKLSGSSTSLRGVFVDMVMQDLQRFRR